MSFYDKVYEAVMTVPKGRVATYGQIAVMCGSPHASRAVGYALHCNPRPGVIPCHRIVNREGTGWCPMESAVLTTDDAEKGYLLLKQRLAAMKK